MNEEASVTMFYFDFDEYIFDLHVEGFACVFYCVNNCILASYVVHSINICIAFAMKRWTILLLPLL